MIALRLPALLAGALGVALLGLACASPPAPDTNSKRANQRSAQPKRRWKSTTTSVLDALSAESSAAMAATSSAASTTPAKPGRWRTKCPKT